MTIGTASFAIDALRKLSASYELCLVFNAVLKDLLQFFLIGWDAHRSIGNFEMTNYRRYYTPGATWFFTVNLAERSHNALLVENIEQLRQAFRYVKQRHPVQIDAIVVLPEHLHTIWTLPEDDTNYSTRWNLLKGHFSRTIEKGERVSASRASKRERGIWQRRFWSHLITDQEDFNRHVDYIHWNPVKHGWVKQPADWPYSSFHHYVKHGFYPSTWGHSSRFDFDAGE